MITSPYNFVPLADEVFRPEWGEPSHDCPFSDGVSGELSIALTAKTPIYIRGAHKKPASNQQLLWTQENPAADTPYAKWTDFYRLHENGPYAIPATSLKGMIRNVIKIAAFGSIADADDEFISVRDLTDDKYKDNITIKRGDGSFEAITRAGWLRWSRDGSKLEITPCELARVEQADTRPEFVNCRSAQQKYDLWEQRIGTLEIDFDIHGGGSHNHTHPGGKELYYAKAIKLRPGNRGELVFTGQPSPQKHMEFIFYDTSAVVLAVSNEIRKQFFDVHTEAGGKDADSWKYWSSKLNAGQKVPVFWLEKSGQVSKFGLAQMFRYPARSVHDAIPPSHKQPGGLDVADRLFGTLREDGVKGRVFFGALTCTKSDDVIRFSKVITTVLGAPRPSFYPAYLEQPAYAMPSGRLNGGKNSYQTWLSPKVRIRGWKRYPVAADAPGNDLEHIRHRTIPTSYGSATAFRPLKAGALFTGTIRFHNLRRAELGALVWALKFGSKDDGTNPFRHSIGMGKSMGMGSCTITMTDSDLKWFGAPELKDQKPLTLESCMEDFEAEMNRSVQNWKGAICIKELLAMANSANGPHFESHKAFPKLLPQQQTNEFRDAKESGLVLPRPSEIIAKKSAARPSLSSGNPPLNQSDGGMTAQDQPASSPKPVPASSASSAIVPPTPPGPETWVGEEKPFRYSKKNKKGNPIFEIEFEAQTISASMPNAEDRQRLPAELSKGSPPISFRITAFVNGCYLITWP